MLSEGSEMDRCSSSVHQLGGRLPEPRSHTSARLGLPWLEEWLRLVGFISLIPAYLD